jgi:hypothetical protein
MRCERAFASIKLLAVIPTGSFTDRFDHMQARKEEVGGPRLMPWDCI